MHKVPTLLLKLAAANGFLAVLLGAFGAHALKNLVPASALGTWETAVQYHMFHVTALLGLCLVIRMTGMTRSLYYSGVGFCAGIMLFCGSLYLMTLTGSSWLGMITPLGGLCFLAAWALLFFAVVSFKHE